MKKISQVYTYRQNQLKILPKLAFVYRMTYIKRVPPANHFAGGTQLITNFFPLWFT